MQVRDEQLKDILEDENEGYLQGVKEADKEEVKE